MLEIHNLHAAIDGQPILKGIDLSVQPGEVHAIMGPNGSGKSTLAAVLAGREDYEVTDGSIGFRGENLLEMAPEDRARAGLFLSFQYPVEIPGVSVATFLKSAINAQRKARGEAEIDAMEFLELAEKKMKLVEMEEAFLSRALNEGFSGGEKKRNEIFQMAMLEPALGILDEIDSGLDIDALRTISAGINALRSPDRSLILITHYQRLLDYIAPDQTHVLMGGRIVKSGGGELVEQLEKHGYRWVEQEMQAGA